MALYLGSAVAKRKGGCVVPRTRTFFLLALWEKVAAAGCRMRGLHPRRQTPHPAAMLRIAATLSHRGNYVLEARKFLEASRWPDGAVCPQCGQLETVKPLGGKSMGPGWYFCSDCREKFTGIEGKRLTYRPADEAAHL
jgi:hypothetical protein